MSEQLYRKVYVDVITVMRRQDGTVLPLSFLWEDGKKYKIDRVKFITPAASLKVGGRGMKIYSHDQRSRTFFSSETKIVGLLKSRLSDNQK